MYKKFFAILFILCLALPVSAKKRQSETIITPMKQLEKRQYQTRTYKSEDKLIVMKALLNVYQDDGFIVYNVNSLLGFIYSAKDFDLSDSETDISKEFGLTKSRLNFNGVNIATLESTVNLTEFGPEMRVRVNFKRKLLNMYGTAQFIDDINDGEYYKDFFEKLDKAIELQKQITSSQIKKTEFQKKEPQNIKTPETPADSTPKTKSPEQQGQKTLQQQQDNLPEEINTQQQSLETEQTQNTNDSKNINENLKPNPSVEKGNSKTDSSAKKEEKINKKAKTETTIKETADNSGKNEDVEILKETSKDKE